VKHRAHARFWKLYRALPQDIRLIADRSYALLCENPSHPSLHFKKVGAFWSSRVGLHYRALAVEAEQDLIWFWIGLHAEYDKLVGRTPANRPLQPASRAGKKRDKSKRRSRG
jgi:hypothetical protein